MIKSISGGAVVEKSERLKECILKSHERCKNAGIPHDRIFSSKILSTEEMHEKTETYKELITIAAPFMQKLYDFVKGSDFFAILTDRDGCILSVMGDEKILSEASNLKMIVGAYMDEEHIGTNSMGMVLKEKIPVQIYGNDHYIKAYHKWTCSAAPVKDSSDEIIGVLNLTGYSKNVHLHTLGMVVAAADAIEQMIKVKKYNDVIRLNQKHMESVFNSIPTSIITSDVDGTIKTLNKQAVYMFGYAENVIMKMKMNEIFDGFDDVREILRKGKTASDEEVYANSAKSRLQLNMNASPVYSSDGKISEIVFIFQEIKKVRKLASKIMAGQAIYTFDKIVGRDKELLKTIEYSKKISDSSSTILIMGESGTGKEVFAQSIHNYSLRKNEPFIAVNCGAIPRNLIESELFGYEEGSFTGARKGGYAGKFEIADGGTIFLDEIGEMPLDMQTKLLRVIEEKTVTRIGSFKAVPVNVRIIAATNKDLKYESERANFRSDLYYRLNVLPIYLKPLRERKGDIPLLFRYFMEHISQKLGKKCINVPEQYMDYLVNYNWPGNIRELENVVELIINTETIPVNLEARDSKNGIKLIESDEEDMSLEFVEQQHIIRVIRKCSGNITAASKILGIGRNTIYKRIQKYGIGCSISGDCSEVQ